MAQPLSQIETPTDSYVTRYPWAVEMARAKILTARGVA